MQYFVVGLLLVIIIASSGWFIFFYNKTTNKKIKIEDSWRQIDALVKLKYDLIWDYVETVCSSANHQEEILIRLVQSRNDLLNTQTPDESKKISKELLELLNRFFMDKGAFPDIEAENNFSLVWQKVEELDEKITLKQQLFNEEVFLYNKSINTFPNAIASKIMNIKQIMVTGLTN